MSSLPCRLTDISGFGLGVDAASAVGTGTMVCVETSAIMVAGTVMRCAPHAKGDFRVGIAITDVMFNRGSERRFVWSVAEMRLRLAEFVLGRSIPGARNPLHVLAGDRR